MADARLLQPLLQRGHFIQISFLRPTHHKFQNHRTFQKAVRMFVDEYLTPDAQVQKRLRLAQPGVT